MVIYRSAGESSAVKQLQVWSSLAYKLTVGNPKIRKDSIILSSFYHQVSLGLAMHMAVNAELRL